MHELNAFRIKERAIACNLDQSVGVTCENNNSLTFSVIVWGGRAEQSLFFSDDMRWLHAHTHMLEPKIFPGPIIFRHMPLPTDSSSRTENVPPCSWRVALLQTAAVTSGSSLGACSSGASCRWKVLAGARRTARTCPVRKLCCSNASCTPMKTWYSQVPRPWALEVVSRVKVTDFDPAAKAVSKTMLVFRS